ncbi:MAG: hypothetical protein OQK25_00575 [Gammaproteobacteria bacterium]|nr:hypothetical protein [Gammaproteobacteria bacterium]
MERQDETSVKKILRSKLACDAIMLPTSKKMSIPTLYSRQQDGKCQRVSWKAGAANYAVDPQCNRPICMMPTICLIYAAFQRNPAQQVVLLVFVTHERGWREDTDGLRDSIDLNNG